MDNWQLRKLKLHSLKLHFNVTDSWVSQVASKCLKELKIYQYGCAVYNLHTCME